MKFQTISLKYFMAAKGAIYYVAIATVIFSHVKITCEDIMFSRENSPGISVVFNKTIIEYIARMRMSRNQL